MTQTARALRSVANVKDRGEEKPWNNFGEFLIAVKTAEVSPGDIDVRFKAERAATGANTGIGSEGGLAVPESILANELEDPFETSHFLSRVSRRPVTQGNEYKGYATDVSSLAGGLQSAGLNLTAVAEAGTYAYTWPRLRQVRMSMGKWGTVVPASNELIEDAESFGADIADIANDAMRYLMENLAWNGLGGAQPIGVANHTAGYSLVAIEATQTIANTPTFIRKNIANMVVRAWNLETAVWFCHQDLLASMLTATVNSNAAPIIGPATDVAPFGTIANRPVFPLKCAPAVGTVGDLTLVSPEDYLLASKGELRTAFSPHVRFLQDESLFKFTVRFNGQPKCSKEIAAFSGSNARSPYVVLAGRA